MKSIAFSFLFTIAVFVSAAQTPLKQYTIGDPFSISLPGYLQRTAGLNSSAVFQYQNEEKGVYGFIIPDDKVELKILEVELTLQEFFDDFVKDFIEGEDKVKKSQPVISKKGDVAFCEGDLSFYDKEAKTEIYYLVGVIETKTSFYKILSYCSLEDKAAFREDFKKILYSFKD